MTLAKHILKLLSFKFKREDYLSLNNQHLVVGILGTWVAGMGRYWDDDNASILQHLGLGSAIYIFALSLFIWFIILPLKVNNWTYKLVLSFISLTSFPAILYAIPVERFYGVKIANTLNFWFLAIVALWRLILLFKFLKTVTQFTIGKIFVITLMPICVIISSLTALNLHKVVFNFMSGIRNETAHDKAYFFLLFLTWISILLSIPLLLGYFYCIYARHKELKLPNTSKQINKLIERMESETNE